MVHVDHSYSDDVDNLLFCVYDFKLKKNDTVKFIFRKKRMTGKVTKIGSHGIDVLSNNGYYYCTNFNQKTRVFQKSNYTKNYK